MLQIRLLGQFDVRLDGKRVLISSRAGQSLLAYLALSAGTQHRREKLAGIFWPEVTEEKARTYLRHELWRIRKAIPAQGLAAADEYLLADEFTLAFNPHSDHWLDVAILERQAQDADSLASGLSLYQGELLPGFYDDWVLLERERIQTIFDAQMNQLVSRLVDAERWTAVQEQCERWLSFVHASEPAYRALMLSYSARGDMAKVSAVYRRCVESLQEQFGVEPSTETAALYKGLLKGARIPGRPAPAGEPGTVTVLFADIEGSTRLHNKLGDKYSRLLEEYHGILRTAAGKWNGKEVETQEGAVFVTFPRALDAVQCAAEIQRALAGHAWSFNESPRVRIGLHTGEPLVPATGIVGMEIHRAARIGDAAHGGQVLLSQTTRESVIHDLPRGIVVQDLGDHRLKDMKYSASIHQLVMEGLPADFPILKTKFNLSEAPTPGEPPFMGLQYFDEVNADLFFGRELLTSKLVHRLCESGFLSVIIGASGSGKSSLVRAGLIPAIKKGEVLPDGTRPPEGSLDWQIHIITPTAHPLETLAAELTRESAISAAVLLEDLKQNPRSLSHFLARQDTGRHTLLVVDQLEELFTLCRDEFEREAFIDNLLYTLDRQEHQLTLVLTLRADFYAHLAQYPELRDAVAKQQAYIGQMTSEELRRAIEEPARRGHWEFEPGLVDLILRDVGDEPGALPLLSHALLETWKRRAGHILTLKGYADAGGVLGAIAHTAETVYRQLTPNEQGITRDILLRLTELGEGTEDTRRRAPFSELMSSADSNLEVKAVLNILADARLITLGEGTAEVAHEALIREWPTLREWLNQDREGLRLHRRITETAYEWELLERDPGALYRGAQLAQAREWAGLHPAALNEAERAFLAASMNQEQREERERQEQQRRELEAAHKLAETEKARAEEQIRSANRLRVRNRVITVVGLLAFILAVTALGFGAKSNRSAELAQAAEVQAEQQRDSALSARATAQAEQGRAEEEKKVAISRELAVAAVNNLDVDPELSILLALRALSVTHTSEAEAALRQAVQTSRVMFAVPGNAWGICYSPDGKLLATGNGDGTISILDAVTGEEQLRFGNHSDGISSVTFDPEGKRLATASNDGLAKVWEAATGQELLTLSGHESHVIQVRFSPDGQHLLTGSADATLRLWDAATGQELLVLSDHSALASGDFSPDGQRLMTGSEDLTVKIRDAKTGRVLSTPNGDAAKEVLYSPDGSRFITGTSDGLNLKMWDAATGEELFMLDVEPPYQFVFSRDGKKLVTVSRSGTAKIWDAVTGKALLSVVDPGGFVGVDFHPAGKHIAGTSFDGTVRVWDISPEGGREWFTLTPHGGGWVRRVAYSPDGTRLATAGADGTAKVFDSKTGRELLTLAGHTDFVFGLAYSPEGSQLATSSYDKTIRIWDAGSGRLLSLLSKPGHGDGNVGQLFPGILDVAFNHDGTQLASAGADGTVILWDTATGGELLSISNHGVGLTNVLFSPDGERLLIASDQDPGLELDGSVKMWDLATNRELFQVVQPVRVWGLAFTHDGKRFATGAFDGALRLWDAGTGELLLELPGHTATITEIRFSPDEHIIATSSTDGTVKLWDVDTGRELLTLTDHTESVTGLDFSPDGTRLATASRDGTMRVHILTLAELTKIARSRVTRTLTGEECQKYLHLEQCPSEP